MLNTEIEELKSELQNVIASNQENQQQTTSLSKELYAISAISTKINQSMNFNKSLRKSMAKVREVFKAAGVIIYFKKPTSSQLKLSAVQLENGRADPALLGKIEKIFLPEIVSQGRPLIKDQRLHHYLNGIADQAFAPFQLIVGAPMKSKEKTIGALILLPDASDNFSPASLRLLSGIANIMGMAIENMNLYRQSQQKKREAAFLVQSISKFNEKLDLEDTLKSVAIKGAEFIGKKCRVYLFSETKFPLIQVSNQIFGRKIYLKSRSYKKIEPRELEDFYRLMKSQKCSSLIKNINRSKKIGMDIKPYFLQRDIQSLMTVPLRLTGKKVGLLLLSNGGGKRTFDRHDLTVAEALGAAASVAIENARAYAASEEMSDFLEKKISEKTSQLQQIEERQKIRVENRKDIIFRVNKRNRFVFVNKAMEDLTGCSREALYRGDIQAENVIAAEDRERVKEYFRRIIKRELPMVKDLEYRHLNQKGEDHMISLTVYPEMDKFGRLIGLEGVGRDITEEKRLEAELERAKDLALLGEFSSAIAHQIRNPLGNILMGTKLLQRAMGLDGDGTPSAYPNGKKKSFSIQDRKTLASIFGDLSEGIQNLNQVVTELVKYTKTLKLSRSSQKVDTILGETLSIFQDMITQNGIKIEKRFDTQLAPLSVDAVLIAQVFQNVIHNAIQAMPSGGWLSVSTGISYHKTGYAMISISDTGIGIGPSEIEKIFHPFYTTKDSGIGLGLSLAHRIIDAHGGVIWVCPNPCPHHVARVYEDKIQRRMLSSEGVTFHILLPVGENPTRQGKEHETADTVG